MDLYTKEGRPLQVSAEILYSRSGRPVGRIKGSKVFGTDGRYVGTIVGDRLVYRSTDRAAVGSPFSVANAREAPERDALARQSGVMNRTF